MSDMDDLIKQIRIEGERLAKLKGTSRKPKLHPPPSPNSLARAIKSMPVLPPSPYLDFLRKYNGWENFWNGFSIIAVSGKHNKAAVEDVNVTIQEDTESLLSTYEDKTSEQFTQEEERDRDFIYLPNHLIFATDFNGQLALFDRRTRDSKGEMEVVRWSHDGGIYGRYPSFKEFLEFVLNDIRAEIKKIEQKPPPPQMDEATRAQRAAKLRLLQSAIEETYKEMYKSQKKDTENRE